MSTTTRRMLVVLNSMIIVSAVCFFVLADRQAHSSRKLPPERPGNAPAPVYSVDTQGDVYNVYRRMGIYGARVLHLNRFFNLTKHAPGEIERPEPFPLSVADPGPLYEKGIDSHNWLYIATRTGLVRSIISVLPDSVFRSRLSELRENPYFSFRPPAFIGYSFDTPRSVVTLEALSRVIEPVIINVDAGYFIDGNDPKKVVTMLRNACPDIRGIVIVRSSDEPDVDERMTGKLQQFHDLWQRL